MKGIVEWYNQMIGYGFISAEDGRSIFVHYTSIPEKMVLREGDKVEFDIKIASQGPKAVNIKKEEE